jgi:DNA-binding NtrC family response regulator
MSSTTAELIESSRLGLTCRLLIGESTAFCHLLHCVERVSKCDATVLLVGETGTGKELVARRIHALGRRSRFPFVPINCGAIPESLVESELFGHAKGSFTDARETHIGLVADAQGGTLFLDEIECLPRKGQVVLLRFLQDQSYRPVGGRRQMRGNVRIIAASNRNLGEMKQTGEFREDLFYRLAILPLTLPPLRERGTDVLLLAEYFIHRYADRYLGGRCPELSRGSITELLHYDWPGNVRELENLIHQHILMQDGPVLDLSVPTHRREHVTPTETPWDIPLHLTYNQAKAAVVTMFERRFLTHALAESDGNVSEAARRVGKERRAFGKLLKKHGIDRLDYCSG